jgi:hypothetical protein
MLLIGVLGAQVDGPKAEQLIDAMVRERDLGKKQDYLEQWIAQNPHQAIDPIIDAAKRVLSSTPDDFGAQFALVAMTPGASQPSPQTLLSAAIAAEALLEKGIENEFTAANRPETVSATRWQEHRTQALGTVHRTLGWIAVQRQDHITAEKHLVQSLEVDPENVLASYWLAQDLIAQNDAANSDLTLFSVARAAAYDGKGALAPELRTKLDEYLAQAYTAYTGTDDGLEGLKQIAQTHALPPSDFKLGKAEVRNTSESPSGCRIYGAVRVGCGANEGARSREATIAKARPPGCSALLSIAYSDERGGVRHNSVPPSFNRWVKGKEYRKNFADLCWTRDEREADYVLVWTDESESVTYTYRVPTKETSTVSLHTRASNVWDLNRTVHADTTGTITTKGYETRTGTATIRQYSFAVYEVLRGESSKVFENFRRGKQSWSKPDKEALVDVLMFLQERRKNRR